MSKLQEYAKALTALVVSVLLGVVANVTDAIDANLEPVQIALVALINAVLVALVPNKPPTAEG